MSSKYLVLILILWGSLYISCKKDSSQLPPPKPIAKENGFTWMEDGHSWTYDVYINDTLNNKETFLETWSFSLKKNPQGYYLSGQTADGPVDSAFYKNEYEMGAMDSIVFKKAILKANPILGDTLKNDHGYFVVQDKDVNISVPAGEFKAFKLEEFSKWKRNHRLLYYLSDVNGFIRIEVYSNSLKLRKIYRLKSKNF